MLIIADCSAVQLKRGRLKKGGGMAREICSHVWANFNQKRQNKGQTSQKFVSFLLSSLIQGMSKKCYSFPISKYKNMVFYEFMNLIRENKKGGWIFILSGQIFNRRTGWKVQSRAGNIRLRPAGTGTVGLGWLRLGHSWSDVSDVTRCHSKTTEFTESICSLVRLWPCYLD